MSEILVPVSTLLADAKTAIEDFLSTGKNLVGKALTIGDRLVVLKHGVPYGEYGKLEKALANYYGLTTRTLRNYRDAAMAVADGYSTREDAIAIGLKGVLAAWRGHTLSPPESEPATDELETVSNLPKPKTANTIATLQTENDALKATKAMLEARLAALEAGDVPPEDPADDAYKPADDDDNASDTEDLSDGEDVSADGVRASEGAGVDDDGGGAGVVGGAANTMTVCMPSNVARKILTLAADLLPERGVRTVEGYMKQAEADPTNAAKHRRMADIVRLNDLLKAALGG